MNTWCSQAAGQDPQTCTPKGFHCTECDSHKNVKRTKTSNESRPAPPCVISLIDWAASHLEVATPADAWPTPHSPSLASGLCPK